MAEERSTRTIEGRGPQITKGAGYRTGVVGKWGLGDPDNPGVTWRQGFDSTFGFLNRKRAQTLYTDFLWRDDKTVPFAHGEYANGLFTREASSFVRRGPGKPFLPCLAYTVPHANSDLARLKSRRG